MARRHHRMHFQVVAPILIPPDQVEYATLPDGALYILFAQVRASCLFHSEAYRSASASSLQQPRQRLRRSCE